ncbi:MAG: acyl-CoA dehydrogenase family protein [Bradymonadales bacterium]|nr:acyl-CoA dehydrogenase family protein [Bradymonadales bacterium]
MIQPIERGRQDLLAWEASRPENLFSADPNIQHVLEMYLQERYPALEPDLRHTGALAGPRMDALAIECNRDANLPQLQRYSGVGDRTEAIVFDPAQSELNQLVWSSGLLSALATPGNEVYVGGLAYLLDQNGEAGTACPVACTAGAIKLLQMVGSEQQQRLYLPGLCQSDASRRLVASQFVTEVQGGSDVGSNACVAEPAVERPGWFRITGEKWFCSVIDADLFLLTARPAGAVPGTRGLGLFLVPRRIDGQVNRFFIRRLKDKLGTRSLASAEVDFDGALGEPLGPIDQGFKLVIGVVLDTSRVHNGIAACGFMRRALDEAHRFASIRQAFGSPISHFPAVQEIVARMKVLTQAAVASTFRILDMTDRLATGRGSRQLAEARRTHVNINKYWTAIRCTQVVRDGIEILGGNGTIEEFSVLPRLYRDAIVVESWEGTHNTLCAQVLRDFSSRGLHRPWLAEVESTLDSVLHPACSEMKARLVALGKEVADHIEGLLQADPKTAGFRIRHVVDRMCLYHTGVSLLKELDWEATRGYGEQKRDLIELFVSLYVDPADPLHDERLPRLCQELARTI